MSEEIKPKKERKFLKALGKIGEVLIQELFFRVGSNLIRKIGGKKPLPSILFIFLSLSLFAQFPNTGNKQRLGFQTTGDGLVWRGALSDTASIQPINNQSAWVILDTVNLKMYSFDFTSNVWNLVGGAQGLTMPFDSITFNTAKDGTVGVGEVEYNDTQGSLIQGLKGGNVTNVIGQQLHQRVNNRTGAPLAKGDVVYLAGSQGNRITVAKGLAVSDAFSANTFGVVAENIADNQSGFIITEGLITGLNTSALTEDSAVYLSPTVAGALTSTKPQAPQHSVYIGVCVKSNNGSGELFVKIRNGQELDELHDVRISNPINNASLYYKLSEKLWRDTTAALLVSDTASMLTPYFRDADTVTLSNRINLKLNIADTSAFARDNQISGTSGQVAYFNSSNSVISDAGLIYNATNKSLGINTTTTSGANLIIKNSQEPVRSTVVATQTFAADTTNWTRGAGWTFNGTQAVATAATGDLTYTPALTITSGNAYEVTYSNTYTSGTLTLRFGSFIYNLPSAANNINTVVVRPTSATGGFRFTTSSFTGTLDNVSVVEISNPAPILFAGQDNNTTTLYSSLRMPNSTSVGYGGGGAYTTGENNVFYGFNAGRNNTTGLSNVFMGNSTGINNTTGSNNYFFGLNAGFNNTTGSNSVFIGTNAGLLSNADRNFFFGSFAGENTTTGTGNTMFAYTAGRNNTTGRNNMFLGSSAGLWNKSGSNNVFIGNTTGPQTIADTLLGDNNIAIGTNAADNIRASATSNVAIGYQVDLPTNNGSYQGVYQNVLFFTGASATQTTIAAASKAGIKTNAPNRDLEVAGEVRITDLTTDAPTRLVGADADGDLGQVTLGAGLSLATSSLLADTSFLVTRFDTASMLTNYLRTGTAASTYLPLTGGTLTGGLTGTSATFLSNVGIGTNAPLNLLEVSKSNNDTSTSLRVTNSFSATGSTDETADIDFYQGSGGGYFTSGRVRSFREGDYLTSNTQIAGGLSFWTQTSNAIPSNGFTEKMRIMANGNVGIGTPTPSFKLDVNGTLGVTGATTLSAPLTVNSSAVFNEGAADADFRVESVGNAHMVFVDASTDRVGIGYASPTKTLDVNGEVRINTVTATPTSLLGKDGSNVVGEVTTVAQTGLMKSGGTTANTSSVGIITVAHGLSYTPSQVISTISQQNSYVIVCHSKDANNLSFTVYDSVTGNPLNNVSVGFFWLAIK